ncbi:hypothetical protein KSS87_015896 [Heliosperma pusillum]|nr:hypothetical protein KSS87_008819 [Heliosperma pusillum]KAH9608857.1 hypothetical protein KSS87_015896 [Heliosperma pusillum]
MALAAVIFFLLIILPSEISVFTKDGADGVYDIYSKLFVLVFLSQKAGLQDVPNTLLYNERKMVEHVVQPVAAVSTSNRERAPDHSPSPKSHVALHYGTQTSPGKPPASQPPPPIRRVVEPITGFPSAPLPPGCCNGNPPVILH